ncbi:MAG: sugar transferase [Chlamydiae bacterium]|nr:sugar transferase [Chlamydiota bacterium]
MQEITDLDVDTALSSFFSKNQGVKPNIPKRCFDIGFSLSILVLLFPLYLILALMIKTTSKGPVFYDSKRIGAAGKVISCWKFRSMSPDAEQKLNDLLSSNPDLHKEWKEHFKLRHDPRITKLGAFLRKTSLDELPQFWNVLKGDLSTVGPRPLSKEEVFHVVKYGRGKIYTVKPGITGLWQISGRSLIPFEARLQIEEEYVEKQSLILDLQLIVKTLPLLIFPKGAF